MQLLEGTIFVNRGVEKSVREAGRKEKLKEK